MWIALGLWQTGWILGLAFGYWAMPEFNVVMLLMGSATSGGLGATLGAMVTAKALDSDSVAKLAGSGGGHSPLESLIRATPGVTMACAALVGLPAAVAWALGLVSAAHVLLAATMGAWSSAWVCSGARKLPAGIVMILTLWTLAGTAGVIKLQEESTPLVSYLRCELVMLVSVVIGLLVVRALVLLVLGPTRKVKDEGSSGF